MGILQKIAVPNHATLRGNQAAQPEPAAASVPVPGPVGSAAAGSAAPLRVLGQQLPGEPSMPSWATQSLQRRLEEVHMHRHAAKGAKSVVGPFGSSSSSAPTFPSQVTLPPPRMGVLRPRAHASSAHTAPSAPALRVAVSWGAPSTASQAGACSWPRL